MEGYYPQHEVFFDPGQFPFLYDISRHHDTIFREILQIRNTDIWRSMLLSTQDSFPLKLLGVWCKKTIEKLPKTYEILKDVPNIHSVSVSRLFPGRVIQPHRGWGPLANGILRCHLGIDVPDNCGCVCENWVQPHENGGWVIFDDSKMHTSFNYGERKRYIMIVDITRPESIPRGQCKLAHTDTLNGYIETFFDEDAKAELYKRIDDICSNE